MRLRIAGVYHADPISRRRLRDWLKRPSIEETDPLAFVATEWGRGVFERVKAQRSRFLCLARREWPEAGPDFLNELALSVAFEADTHVEFFPNVEILWLDEGRQISDPSVVDRYAEDRLDSYKDYLKGQVLPRDTASALTKLSEAIRQPEHRFSNEPGRDIRFAELVLNKIRRGRGYWAIAIVGATHASDDKGSMRQLLEGGGQPCEVTML